jgi:hypothetical protein
MTFEQLKKKMTTKYYTLFVPVKKGRRSVAVEEYWPVYRIKEVYEDTPRKIKK